MLVFGVGGESFGLAVTLCRLIIRRGVKVKGKGEGQLRIGHEGPEGE